MTIQSGVAEGCRREMQKMGEQRRAKRGVTEGCSRRKEKRRS